MARNKLNLGPRLPPIGLGEIDAERAHRYSIDNAHDLADAGLVGCFDCLEIFDARIIREWVDDGRTAMCPFCGIDSLLPDNVGFPVEKWFLQLMHARYMGGDGSDA